VFKHRTIILRVAGLFVSCVLVLVGILMLRRSSIIPGIVATVAATLLFVLTAFFNEKYPLGDADAQAFKPYLASVLFWLGSAVSLIFVINTLSNDDRTARADYLANAGWLVSLLFLVIGTFWITHWKPLKWRQIKDWIGQNKQELLIVTALLLVGALLRTYILTLHPFPWSGDESSIGTDASRILKGEVTNFFEGGWSGQPNWSFIPTAITEIIFGKTILAVRLVSMLDGTLTILFTYLLARELFDRNKTIALVAAGFMVAFPLHLEFSRIGVNNIMDSLNASMVLWLVVRAIRTDRPGDYLWAGILGGLTFYTYIGSRLVLALAVVVLAYTAIRQRGYLRSHLSHLGIFLVGAGVTIAPEGYYFLRHREVFMTRWSQANILSNHWLINASQNAGLSIPAFLWKHFTDTILVYISNPAVGAIFNSPMPYLTILGSIFFLFGMGYAFFKFLDPKMMTLLVWFWAVVFFGGFMTQDAPANARLIMSLPAVALLLALGIYKFTDYLLRMKLINQHWQKIISATIVLILIGQNIAFYFGVYYIRDYNEDANAELGQITGLELQQLGPDYDLYLFGTPRVFAAFPTTVFLAPENGLFDMTSEKINNLSLRPGKRNIFVAIPENRSDLGTISLKYPGGTWETTQRRYKQEVLYYAYILPPK
jgi:4-amino-4-deoxy-L-arabinose transferase-like glycosyltransferase